MNRNLLKRVSAIASAMAIGTTAVSCGKSKEAKELQTADQLIHNSYRSVDIDLNIDADYFETAEYINSSGEMLLKGYKNENVKLYVVNKDATAAKELNLKIDKPENGYVNPIVTAGNDGNITVIADITDYGDFKLPDFEDPDFDYRNFDYEAMEKASKESYKLYTFDFDGNAVGNAAEIDLKKYKEDEERVNIYGIESLSDGNILINSSTYLIVLDRSGKVVKEKKLDQNESIDSMVLNSDNKLNVLKYGDDSTKIHTYNSSTLEEDGEPIDVTNIEGGIYEMIAGNEPDTLYVKNGAGIFKIKDGNAEEVVNWVDSDISSGMVMKAIPLENGDFIIVNNDCTLSRLTQRDVSELKNTKVIKLAVMYSSEEVSQKVTDFNKASKDYRIKLIDYGKYNDYSEGDNYLANTGEEQLKKDIIAGNAPDMMIINSRSTLKLLAKKGALVDFYELMQKDTELNKDKLMPSALKLGEVNGKLVGLVPSFYVNTLVCKKKYSDKQGWTFEDMKAAYEKLPEGAELTGYDSKENVFGTLLYSAADKFIDLDKGTCSFNDPEFAEMLEFCNQFPEKPADSQLNTDNFTEEDWENYMKEEELKYINDKALLYDWNIGDIKEYNDMKKVTFNEDISLVGYPSDKGSNGGVLQAESYCAILESSPAKEECWKLIKTFFDEGAQTDQIYCSFPALISAFEKRAEDSTKKDYYIDDDGKKQEIDRIMFVNGKEINVPPLTEDEKNTLMNYIKDIDMIKSDLPLDIMKIINEEMKAYFAGEKTAQAAADMIQSRASILLSEQA
ncbi:MAG: extracellular solute-binding protein [Ruminococcus sp.]|nr:extracellular solute-binding protein [Ruminococcus sp.]